MEVQTFNPREIDLVRHLLQATNGRRIRWRKSDPDRFEAEVRDRRFSVEFVYLMRAEETGCDRSIARLSAFNLTCDYAIGTEGFDMICEMVAHADRKWMETRVTGRSKLNEALRFLRDLV